MLNILAALVIFSLLLRHNFRGTISKPLPTESKKNPKTRSTLVLPLSFMLTAILAAPPQTSAYTGKCVKGDCINGYGILKTKQFVYEGHFKNGQKNGKGTLTLINGSQYTGLFKNNKKHGKGTFVFADGSIYTGQWSNGRMNGQGTFTFADGEKYSGHWKNGFMHGKGIMILHNGVKKAGYWKSNDYISQ